MHNMWSEMQCGVPCGICLGKGKMKCNTNMFKYMLKKS